MLEKLCNLASDDLLNVVCRSCLSLISLRAVVEGDQHLVSTSPPPLPSLHPPLFGRKLQKKRRRLPLFRQKYRVDITTQFPLRFYNIQNKPLHA